MKTAITTGVLLAVCGASWGQVSIEVIGTGLATDISSDGTIVTGNTPGEYETFWWTAETGIVPLGRATVPVIGTGAGTPGISEDGFSVSATIMDDTNTFGTYGLWNMDSGWMQLMPPTPPYGGVFDSYVGSAWGISGDGRTVVGLYWRPGADGSAHACAWTAATGAVDLGSLGNSSRANGANYDGTIITGWASDETGTWQPTVWMRGHLQVLSDVVVGSQGKAVNPSGTIIAGSSHKKPWQNWYTREAAIWTYDDESWNEQLLGVLPGTAQPWGYAYAGDLTDDGSIVVGYNRFTSPYHASGFIWTQEDGMLSVFDFLTDHGIEPDPDLSYSEVTGITGDGKTLVGIALQQVQPYEYKSYLIHICDETVQSHDGDADGDVDLYDVALFQQCFTGPDAEAVPLGCAPFDSDCDKDVDLDDYLGFELLLDGPQ